MNEVTLVLQQKAKYNGSDKYISPDFCFTMYIPQIMSRDRNNEPYDVLVVVIADKFNMDEEYS